jgi:16S rRNA (cytidine1402-2'-O)-methyltransferase
MEYGKLYLVPTPISSNTMDSILLDKDISLVSSLSFFISETPKTTRAFLKDLPLQKKIQDIEIMQFNEHSKDSDIFELLGPLKDGNNIGLISDAGIPSIADPGFRVVKKAQELGVEVVPLVGPSSILLALMSSGLNGQSFAFNGYLNKESEAKRREIKFLEKLCIQRGQTQIFMEPPYRNQSIFKDILDVCERETLLCVAYDIMGEEQKIVTKRVGQWKKERVELGKKPCLFLINRE